MRIPSFMRTIRFRLTLWYVSLLMIMVIALLFGLNVKVGGTVDFSVTSTDQISSTITTS